MVAAKESILNRKSGGRKEDGWVTFLVKDKYERTGFFLRLVSAGRLRRGGGS